MEIELQGIGEMGYIKNKIIFCSFLDFDEETTKNFGTRHLVTS